MMKQQWPKVPFADVVHLNTDRVADPAAAGIERYVGIEHITPGDLRVRSWGLVAEGTTFTNRFQPGQVLFPKRRAYQRKVAVADFEGVCSGDIYVFESRDPAVLLPELLPFICQTDAFFDHAIGTSAGSLSPRTNWSHLAAYELPLPPIDEQRRLVDAFQSVLELDEALEVAHNALQQVKQAKLSRAFGGYSPPPKDWGTLDSYCERIGDGTHLPPIFEASGIPFLLVSNISSGHLNGPIEKWISQETYEELTKRFKPAVGDLLYSLVGSYGIPVYVDWDWPFSFQRHIGVIRTKENVLRGKYLYHFLQSLPAKFQANLLAEGLAQKTITLTSLRSYRVPLLAVDQQDELVREFDNLDNAGIGLNKRTLALKQLKRHLLNELRPEGVTV